MANIVIRVKPNTSISYLSVYRRQFGIKVIDSSEKAILVVDVTKAEVEKLKKDHLISVMPERKVPLEDPRPRPKRRS